VFELCGPNCKQLVNATEVGVGEHDFILPVTQLQRKDESPLRYVCVSMCITLTPPVSIPLRLIGYDVHRREERQEKYSFDVYECIKDYPTAAGRCHMSYVIVIE
jgi:hypothetical protein